MRCRPRRVGSLPSGVGSFTATYILVLVIINVVNNDKLLLSSTDESLPRALDSAVALRLQCGFNPKVVSGLTDTPYGLLPRKAPRPFQHAHPWVHLVALHSQSHRPMRRDLFTEPDVCTRACQ